MQSATKLRHESNAAYQISPISISDTNERAKKEVGGRGGAYKSYYSESYLVVIIVVVVVVVV